MTPGGARVLYAAFDVYPSPKGAGTHIAQAADTLFRVAGGGLLVTLGDASLPRYQREGAVEIVRLHAPARNFLARTLQFGAALGELAQVHAPTLELVHFRDPWSGLPLLAPAQRRYRAVYEVNGLPSIELPYRYPRLGASTLAKLRSLEQRCLDEADAVVTPSRTLADHLVGRGVPAARIEVIPNGASPHPPLPRPEGAPERYLLYVGALQPWQGVPVLLRAFARLADRTDLTLVICAARSKRLLRAHERLAAKLGVAARVRFELSLPGTAVAAWLQHALVTVAPLTECSRNVDQGCCPLKILESMAEGVPVVASDLPAVREILEDGQHGRLVPPDRPGELARALRALVDDAPARARMGQAAREHVVAHFTWDVANRALAALYARVGFFEVTV